MRHNDLLHSAMLNIVNTKPVLINFSVKLAGKTVKYVTENGLRVHSEAVFRLIMFFNIIFQQNGQFPSVSGQQTPNKYKKNRENRL